MYTMCANALIIPLLILTLVHTWYEESNPRANIDVQLRRFAPLQGPCSFKGIGIGVIMC